MKFAFSTESCTGWDLASIPGKAADYGFDGVEVTTAAGASSIPEALTLDDPARNLEVLAAFKSQRIEIAAIASEVRMTGNRNADTNALGVLKGWVDRAAELACPRVTLRDPAPQRGRSAAAAGMALGDWLVPAADHALTRGVTLLVCNDATLTLAGSMWMMLERLCHPAVACCWDLENGVRAGESPSVSVPTLNSRIRYARVGNTSAAAGGQRTSSFVELFLTRLRGIGYDGYVTAAGRSSGMVADENLRSAIVGLKEWGRPVSPTAPGRRKQETRPRAG